MCSIRVHAPDRVYLTLPTSRFCCVSSFFEKVAMAGWIQSGEVRARRSPWRLSIIPDTFFALVNTILAFFRTMFSLDAHQNYGKRSDNRRPGSYSGGGGGFGPGGPGGPGGPSGGGGRGPPRGMDNVRGIDHSAPTPCGSCCAG